MTSGLQSQIHFALRAINPTALMSGEMNDFVKHPRRSWATKQNGKSLKFMNIKNVVVGLFLLVSLSSVSLQAQTNVSPAGTKSHSVDVEKTLVVLEKVLGDENKLSDEQIPKVRAIFEKQINQTWSLSPKERPKKMGAIIQEAHDQMKATLTPKQFEIYWQVFQPAIAPAPNKVGQ